MSVSQSVNQYILHAEDALPCIKNVQFCSQFHTDGVCIAKVDM